MPRKGTEPEMLHAMTPRRRRRPGPEEIDALTQVVEQLTEQVRLLRLSVNEIEEELGWAIRSRVIPHLPPPALRPITSFPVDPLADNFGQRVNAVSGETLAALRQSLVSGKQGELW